VPSIRWSDRPADELRERLNSTQNAKHDTQTAQHAAAELHHSGPWWCGLGLDSIQQARTATRRHYEQTRADQQQRLTESFSKAVEQLANTEIVARLGGIYTLERLAIESIAQVRSSPWWRFLPRLLRNRIPPSPGIDLYLYWTLMETLTAFVRERAKWQPATAAAGRTEESDVAPPARATDIEAVLRVIRLRPQAGRVCERERGWRFDFSDTDLRFARFSGEHLEGASFIGAHLERAGFLGGHFEGADFSGAHLQGASFLSTHLEGAIFDGTHLEGARFGDTHLEGASLYLAHLDDAEGLVNAYGDANTSLPDKIVRPAHWPAFAPEEARATQLEELVSTWEAIERDRREAEKAKEC
jgi:hypothetical protein